MISYLSIDLDYFFYEGFEVVDKFEPFMKSLDKICDSKNIKPKIVTFHDELLKYVNKSKIDTLIHVDYHSDITDYSKVDLTKDNLNEGTWINFIKNRKNIDFHWFGTIDNNLAYCDKFNVIGKKELGSFDPFNSKNLDKLGFKSTKKTFRKLPKKEVLDSVIDVGISISPNWIFWNHYKTIDKVLKKYKFVEDDFCVKELT